MQRLFCRNDLVDSHATAQSRKLCFWNEHFLSKESQCFCLYCDLRCCNDYYMKKICSTRSFHLAQQFFSSSLYAKRCLSLTKLCFHFHDVHDKQQRESCDEILKNVFQCFRVTTGFIEFSRGPFQIITSVTHSSKIAFLAHIRRDTNPCKTLAVITMVTLCAIEASLVASSVHASLRQFPYRR